MTVRHWTLSTGHPEKMTNDLLDRTRACLAAFWDLYKNSETRAHTELEIRMGSTASGRFRPGVTQHLFQTLESEIRQELEPVDRWEEVVDFFYALPNGTTARTRVVYDTNSLRALTEHRWKQKCASMVLSCGCEAGDACRVSVCVEHPVTPPDATVLTLVRIKHRKQFVHRVHGRDVWMYEFNKTWSGDTLENAERNKISQDPIYEIEWELLLCSENPMLAKTEDEFVHSVLRKTRMLLGDDSDDLQLKASQNT